jgi:hypothetical protein
MDITVSKALLRKSSAERARLIGDVRRYVTNDTFINILSNLDVNDTKQISRVCRQLSAFNSLEALWDEVELWLGS